MKNSIRSQMLLTLLTTAFLAACGSGDGDAYLINGVSLTGCTVPPGTRQSSVIGNIQGQGSLTLDIFPATGGAIEAYGMLNIPNLGALTGQMSTGLNTGILNNGIGATSSIKTCVSTNGVIGTLDYAGSQQAINVVLTGPGGVQVELGNGTPSVAPYISGDRLYGGMYILIPQLGNIDAVMN